MIMRLMAPLTEVLRKENGEDVATIVHELRDAVVEEGLLLTQHQKPLMQVHVARIAAVQAVLAVSGETTLVLAPAKQPVIRRFFFGGDGFQELDGGGHHAVGVLHELCAPLLDRTRTIEDVEEDVRIVLENGTV